MVIKIQNWICFIIDRKQTTIGGTLVMRERINELSELREKGLCIIEDDMITVKNNILTILDQKDLLISDLAKLTGISRQNINAVVRNKMKPGIDFVLKVSFVLGVPAEKLFHLTDDAWIKPYKHERDATLYIDLVNLEIVDTKEKRKAIAETKHEYFQVETGELLTKEDYESRLKDYIDQNRVYKQDTLKEEDDELTVNQIKSLAVEELKSEFNSQYSKIYKKLGRRIVPYVVS